MAPRSHSCNSTRNNPFPSPSAGTYILFFGRNGHTLIITPLNGVYLSPKILILGTEQQCQPAPISRWTLYESLISSIKGHHYACSTWTNGLSLWNLDLERKRKPCQQNLKWGYMNIQTSQELRMLSSVTLNCQATKIVMNSGSQLSEL